MKLIFAAAISVITFSAYSGEMGGVLEELSKITFISVSGGYFTGNFEVDSLRYTSGVISSQRTFNDTYNNGYGQLALGMQSKISGLSFIHQLVVSKLGGLMKFTTYNSNLTYSQTVDFGYDWMPKISGFKSNIEVFGILGVHYGLFDFKKIPYLTATSSGSYDNNQNLIGFNLGAAAYYQVNPKVELGIKYQHWQYGATQLNGTNTAEGLSLKHKVTPTFNLVGAELRYWWA